MERPDGPQKPNDGCAKLISIVFISIFVLIAGTFGVCLLMVAGMGHN